MRLLAAARHPSAVALALLLQAAAPAPPTGAAGEGFGPLALGASFAALWERAGATPFTLSGPWPGTDSARVAAYWEGLGLLVWARDDRVVGVVYWSAGTGPAGGRHPLLPAPPDGLRFGSPAEAVESAYGTPPVRRAFSTRFEGLHPLEAEEWIYPISQRLVYVHSGRVVGLGLFDAQAYYGVTPDRLRTVVPGRSFSATELGAPVAQLVRRRGAPALERPDPGGVVMLWFLPPDTIEASAARDLSLRSIVVRSWQSTPGAVRSEARWYRTPSGVRLGMAADRLPGLLGAPRRVETAPADFQPLGAAPLRADVERRFYDGLIVEVKDGRVWGLGVY